VAIIRKRDLQRIGVSSNVNMLCLPSRTWLM